MGYAATLFAFAIRPEETISDRIVYNNPRTLWGWFDCTKVSLHTSGIAGSTDNQNSVTTPSTEDGDRDASAQSSEDQEGERCDRGSWSDTSAQSRLCHACALEANHRGERLCSLKSVMELTDNSLFLPR